MAPIDYRTSLAIFELTRPLNGLIIFLSVIVAALLAGAQREDVELVFLAATTALFIGAGGYVINDYFDLRIDVVNKPHRPLPRQAVSHRAAFILWLITTLIGLVLSLLLPPHAALLAMLVAIILFLYSYKFKRIVFLSNLAIAALTALVFVYGASIVGNIQQAMFPAIFAFLTNLMREISKDIEDMDGDRLHGVRTIPLRYGVPAAYRIIVVVAAIFIVLSFVPPLMNVYNLYYFVLVSAIDVSLFLYIIFLLKSQTPASFSTFSTLLKLLMVLGLIAIYVGNLDL